MSNKTSNSRFRNHLQEILLLLSVPAVITIIGIACIYIPRALAHPAYDFVFCTGSNCADNFSIESGKLTRNSDDSVKKYRDTNSLYYYTVKDDTTRKITIDEAANYSLDATSKAPDGYSLDFQRGKDGPFVGSSANSWSLRKGLASKPIRLANGSNGRYYSTDTYFLGWVISHE